MAQDDYPARTYSQLYNPPDENSGDNPRTRRRMAKAFEKAAKQLNVLVADKIEEELGIEGPRVYPNTGVFVNLTKYLNELPWGDFLSTFSILFECLGETRGPGIEDKIKKLARTLRRIFVEENARLTLGRDGIIHPKIDRAFEYSRAALVRGTNAAEYEAVKVHLESVDDALLSEPPDGAAAIRSIFLAAENVFKQMSKRGTNRLGDKAAKQELNPLLERAYGNRTHERNVANQQLNGFCNWINAAHHYRHDAGKQEPSQPPEEMYISLVSEGFAWVRWLVDLRRITSDS